MDLEPSSSTAATAHSSSSFMPASLPTAGSGDYMQRSLTESAATMNDMVRTNALADRNTIVDMSLRLARFVLCVAAALVFAFAFALLTSNRKTLKYVYEDKLAANETLSTKASSVVEDYNTLFGYILFSGGKVFEVFCETLIFPTLATYLHNCSLYPGDQPARVHSIVKARCIFWGLKTVIILMNVGFTSVYVGQTTEPVTSRRLAVSDGLTGTLLQMETPWAVDSEADVLHSILRTSVTGVTTPFEFEDSCKWSELGNKEAKQQWAAWGDDVDTTSVSFSFPSHAWNAALLSSETTSLTTAVEIPLRDYLINREKYTTTDDWDAAELYSTFQQGLGRLGLASASASEPISPTFDDLVHGVASELKAQLPSNARVSDLVLRVERRQMAEDMQFTTITFSVPVETGKEGSTLCGASGCVFATSTSVLEQLHMQPGVSIASYGQDDENSALVYSASSQYVQEMGTPRAPHEVLTLSMGKLTWQLSPLHIRHDAACLDDGDQQCLGLSLPFATGGGVLLVGKDALPTQHAARPVDLVALHPAVIPDMTRPEDDALVSWHRLVSSNGMLVRPSSSECTSLVDAYLTHLESNHFYLDGRPAEALYSAALLYLLQRGVPTSYADSTSRRRLALSAMMASSGSGSGSDNDTSPATTDIEVNVPTATALVTVAGCIFIVLLMLCVIYLPTARVKLSPDTTPAAQYVQILTDDLYPDVVHKKRLRFANGDCLLFNEYVVDAIVLHAKRDQTKKIYL